MPMLGGKTSTVPAVKHGYTNSLTVSRSLREGNHIYIRIKQGYFRGSIEIQ